jgi:hypothetical protein
MAITIDFDDIQGPAEIDDNYLSQGVKFFKGNGEYGESTMITGSAWVFDYPGAAVSNPNVLIPEPATNNDIIVWFYETNAKRTTAKYIAVKNDDEAQPNNIYLAAFDYSDNLINEVMISGAGTLGEIYADNIWYAKIYSARGTNGHLGVDDFSFELTPNVDVLIDIKPGSYPNSINLDSKGNVPVAIFSSSDFDASTIDPTTITLAGASVRMKGKNKGPQASFEDVNEDGLPDLIVHIIKDELDLDRNSSEAFLEGFTFDGERFIGRDSVNIVPH